MQTWRAVVMCAAVLVRSAAAAEVLTVAECVRMALARAPAVQAAALDASAAAARVRAAQAAYVPRLLAEAQYGRSEGFDERVTNGGVTEGLLTLEATLLDGGLRAAQIGAAKARLRSASAFDQQRRAEVAAAVRTAYFAILAARAEHDVRTDAVQALEQYVTILRRQEQLGLVPHDDVLRAELALSAARTATLSVASTLATARNDLAVFTEIPSSEIEVAEPPPITAEAVADTRVDQSPPVRDAAAAAEAARRDADAARSEWRARFGVSASGGAVGVQPVDTVRHRQGGQFLFDLTVPLADGGAAAARIAAAEAAASAAAALLEQARRSLRLQLAHAAEDARRAQQELLNWQQAAPLAAEHFEWMRARYLGGGNVRLLEVLDALTQRDDARLNAAQSLLAYRLAVTTTQQLLGEATP